MQRQHWRELGGLHKVHKKRNVYHTGKGNFTGSLVTLGLRSTNSTSYH